MPRKPLKYNLYKALSKNDLARLEALSALEKKNKTVFPDAMADIPGTDPEKVVYNFLKRMRVRFQYQYYQIGYDFSAFPEEVYRPDFILPDWNIIIEIYGEYWHSPLRRRESDLMKWARAIYAGYVVIEDGVATYPEGGSVVGKYIIWWAIDVMHNVSYLFARDIPEIFEIDRKVGEPDPLIIDRQRAFETQRRREARISLARRRPKVEPFQKKFRSLRNRLFDFDKLNPFWKDEKEFYKRYKFPKIKKSESYVPLASKLKRMA